MATTDNVIHAASEASPSALVFTRLTLGVDNLRYDVYLSPEWQNKARQFLFEQILHQAQPHLYGLQRSEARRRSAAAGEFKAALGKLLRTALNQAKEQENIEIKLLGRLALVKWLLAEMQNQFSQLSIQCKEKVEGEGSLLAGSSVHTFMLQSKVADFQSDKRHILNALGETLFQIFEELEEQSLLPARRSLFGDSFEDTYRIVRNLPVFLENPNDSALNLKHYVMLGHFRGDPDHVDDVGEVVSELLCEHGVAASPSQERARLQAEREARVARLQEATRRLREVAARRDGTLPAAGSARARRWVNALSGRNEPEEVDLDQLAKSLEGDRRRLAATVDELERRVAFLRQQETQQLTVALTNPANAERLFGGVSASGKPLPRTEAQQAMLRKLHTRLDQSGMLRYILASYYLKPIYREFCPPLNPHQLKHAVVSRRAWREFLNLLEGFPTQDFPVDKLEDVARRLRRPDRKDVETILVRFTGDLMRQRRDHLHRQLLLALLEKINLVADEKTRRVSRLNRSLYEFLLPEEGEAQEEAVLSHVVIKADVRESTSITEELLRRGLNPATHLSYNFYEPVRKLIARYSASKIFIEGDALILGLFETETNRAAQRPVAKACLLAKEIVEVCQVYNQRARQNDLPILELGLGVAYRPAPPHYWEDGERRIMISAALNHSDRLASCARAARRLVEDDQRFRVYQFQRDLPGRSPDDEEEQMIRYNVMGVALNEEGFRKLQEEIALSPIRMSGELLGQRESITLHGGTVPLGSSFEKLIIREARVPRLLFPGAVLQEWTPHVYYEVCVDRRVYEEPATPL